MEQNERKGPGNQRQRFQSSSGRDQHACSQNASFCCGSQIGRVKYNYIFAETNLDAMNFWVQTKFDIKVSRLISAKQIPNL